MEFRGVTVAVPVLNGMDHLEDLVAAVRNQEWDGALEILICDSSSDDRSFEWADAQPGVTAYQIARESFGHGRTRQQMAERATQPIIVFLTQDAIPNTRLWLAELVRTFGAACDVAAVVGRQVPRPDAPVVVKRDIEMSFAGLGSEFGLTVYTGGPVVERVFGQQPLAFISDANAAYRREVLIEAVPFPDVNYAEDQAIARLLLDAGYSIVYNPFASVEHSNELDSSNFQDRIVAEWHGLYEAVGVLPPTDRPVGRSLVRASLGGVRFALRQPGVAIPRRLADAATVPVYEFHRRRAWRRVAELIRPTGSA